MEMPTSALTGITLKDMFDAGLHFGHQTKRWNPKMKGYIFDTRNGIHIIDLQQSVELLDEAASFVKGVILAGKKLLFVATKKQVSEFVKAAAQDVGQFYVTERWLGGTLTNAKTLRTSVKRMRQLRLTIFSTILLVGYVITYAVFAYFYDLNLNLYASTAYEKGIEIAALPTFHLKFVAVFPVLSIILNCLAIQGIRKDEALVRSLDRIR